MDKRWLLLVVGILTVLGLRHFKVNQTAIVFMGQKYKVQQETQNSKTKVIVMIPEEPRADGTPQLLQFLIIEKQIPQLTLAKAIDNLTRQYSMRETRKGSRQYFGSGNNRGLNVRTFGTWTSWNGFETFVIYQEGISKVSQRNPAQDILASVFSELQTVSQ